jgi:hypothetical protein
MLNFYHACSSTASSKRVVCANNKHPEFGSEHAENLLILVKMRAGGQCGLFYK